MKKLICISEIEQAKAQGNMCISVDANTIVTPAARDCAKALGITLNVTNIPDYSAGTGEGMDRDLIFNVLQALQQRGLLESFIASLGALPFEVMRDPSGVKIIKGKSVQQENYDTGNPNNQVTYRQIIGQEGERLKSGCMTIKNSQFDVITDQEEVLHMVNGTATITVNGTPYAMNTGDTLYLPNGATITYRVSGTADLFYSTT